MNEIKQKIINFEHWLSSGMKSDMPNNIPEELLKLIKESGDAYAFYRNNLYDEFCTDKTDIDLISEFNNFMEESVLLDEHKEIVEYYSDEKITDIFNSKRLNIFEIYEEGTKKGLSQNSCFLYQSYYEIEIILKIFASIVILNKEKRLELAHQNLKDRSNRLKKGICIDFIKARLKDYPNLLNVFTNAYNIKLRNTIGHNNYKISQNSLTSFDNSIKIEKDEFFKSLYQIQILNNRLLSYFSSKSINNLELIKNGILSIGCGVIDNSAVLAIHQLDYFYKLDLEKNWLQKVEFRINQTKIETNLFTKSLLVGEYNEEYKNWLNLVRKKDKLKVLVQSIKRTDKISSNKIIIDCGVFEVSNEFIEKTIDYKII
tara:strand:+ start:609 stop:1724 length:1116 start_codon:yes stop_codon:yes gene_type:complete